jgi:hypothetical protein
VVVLPQFLVTGLSAILFALLEPHRSVLHGKHPGTVPPGTNVTLPLGIRAEETEANPDSIGLIFRCASPVTKSLTQTDISCWIGLVGSVQQSRVYLHGAWLESSRGKMLSKIKAILSGPNPRYYVCLHIPLYLDTSTKQCLLNTIKGGWPDTERPVT